MLASGRLTFSNASTIACSSVAFHISSSILVGAIAGRYLVSQRVQNDLRSYSRSSAMLIAVSKSARNDWSLLTS